MQYKITISNGALKSVKNRISGYLHRDGGEDGAVGAQRSGGLENRGTLTQRELDHVRHKLAVVDEFLCPGDPGLSRELTRGQRELSLALGEGFAAWRELHALREGGAAAEAALSAFYQHGKIRDTLGKTQEFAERLKPEGDADRAREKGYHNYIFFLRLMMAELEERFAQAQTQAPVKPPLEVTPDNVAWFIREECGGIACLCSLPGARSAMEQLAERAVPGQPKEPEFDRAFGALTGAVDEYTDCGDGVEQLRTLTAELRRRGQAVREELERGEAVYAALSSTMTQEWFDGFDPEAEGSAAAGMSCGELKAFYLERIAALREKLPTAPEGEE